MINNEYTIACLLNDSSVQALQSYVPFLEEQNYPHISLFQLRCDDGFLSLLGKYLDNLKVSSLFATTGISVVENNIFLDVLDDSTLQKVSDQLADIYFNYCPNKEPLSQINSSSITLSDNELVKKYGIYWVKENFRPHVTLLYEKYDNYNLDYTFPKHICALEPHIYRIDHKGKILEAQPVKIYSQHFIK